MTVASGLEDPWGVSTRSRREGRPVGILPPVPGGSETKRAYGWVVVAVCLLCTALTSPGQSFAMALYFDALVDDLGTSRLRVSVLYGWGTLAAALLLPFAGRLADRWPARRYLGLVLAGAGAAMLFLASVRSLAGLVLAFFAMRLLCQGAVGLGTLTSVVRWFRRRRGRALAIVALGYSVGELLMPGIIVWLQGEHGWRGSLVVLGTTYLVVAVPLVVLALREPGARIGGFAGPAEPIEETPAEDAPAPPGTGRLPDDIGDTLREALHRPRFWLLLTIMTVSPLVMTGVLIHQVAMFKDAGWQVTSVPAALRMFAACAIVATYGTGLLLERVPAKVGVVLAMALLAAALCIPAGFSGAGGSVLLYGALLGLSAGVTNTTNEVIWPEYHGVVAIGAIKGFVTMGRNGATAAGAPALALLSGEAAVYGVALWICAAACVAVAAIALLLPRPIRPKSGP
jgi:MFS family permease